MKARHALGCAAIVFFISPLAHAIKKISITWVSDLDFGTAVQGDPPVKVAPGATDTRENASFLVSGDHNNAYTIILPDSAQLTTAGGGSNRTLTLTSFASNPPPASGLLNQQGEQLLLIGATRSAIGQAQVAGTYSGSFTITVVY